MTFFERFASGKRQGIHQLFLPLTSTFCGEVGHKRNLSHPCDPDKIPVFGIILLYYNWTQQYSSLCLKRDTI